MIDTLLRMVPHIIEFILLYLCILIISELIQNTKYNLKNRLIILGCTLAMMISGILLMGKFPLNTIIMSAIVFITLSFLLKIKKSKAASIAMLIPLSLIICEILAVSIFMLVLNKKPNEMIEIHWLRYVVTSCTYTCLLLIILIIRKLVVIRYRIRESFRIFNRKYLRTLIYLLLITVVPQSILIPLNKYDYHPTFLILNFFQLLAVSIFLFWYISNLLEKEKMEEQVKTLEMDNKTLGGMVDGVRTIKHDFNNIFQAINGYICSKQYDELDTYILKIMKECNIINTLSIINKNVFDDPANYGVIGSKYFIATENNITMDLDVTVSFKEINFPMAELSRIFGILLDNAIEATSKCDNKYIRVEIKYNPKKNATVIRVVNTFNQDIKINLSNLYTKGYSTKTVKSGLGLWEARRIVSKYKHSQIFATIENDKFVQNLIIENT